MKRSPLTKRPSPRQRKRLAWRQKRKHDLWFRGVRSCGLCDLWIFEFDDCELDHKRCLGMRGDGDTDENTHLVHTLGNRAKGSVPLEMWRKLPVEERRRLCGVKG